VLDDVHPFCGMQKARHSHCGGLVCRHETKVLLKPTGVIRPHERVVSLVGRLLLLGALHVVSGHATAVRLSGLGRLGDSAADDPVGGVLKIIVDLAPGFVLRFWGSMLISHLLGSLKDHGFCGRSHCVVGSSVGMVVFGSCGNIMTSFSVREKVVAIEC
jgi:hypothetical protein